MLIVDKPFVKYFVLANSTYLLSVKQRRGAKTEGDHRGEECIIHLATYTYSSQPSNRHLGVLRMKIGVCGARVCMCVCVCMCAVTGLACHACWRLHTQESVRTCNHQAESVEDENWYMCAYMQASM